MSAAGDLLLHPTRLRIVQALVGAPMTPRELGGVLDDVPQATLYRQLNQLVDGGLIEVVGEQRARGGVERTYGVVTESVVLDDADLESASPEDHFRYFATFVGTLLADFAAYVELGDPQLGRDGAGYRQVSLWLTDDELESLVATLSAAVAEQLDNEPTPGRRRRLLSTIVMPDARS